MTPYDHFVDSIRYFASRDLDAALESARKARDAAPDEQLYIDAARYLEKLKEEQGGHQLYTESDAFSAFISGGGNLPLYDNVRTLLQERLQRLQPKSILDIGSGIGSCIVPVTSALDPIPDLTLCEPALPLLDRAIDFAVDRGLEPEAYPYAIEDVLDQTEDHWDVAISTWTFAYIPQYGRGDLFQTLTRRAGRLFLAEFDDPSGQYEDLLDPARIQHIHERYLEGVSEYPGQAGRRVRIGFLMPHFFGYFAPERQRHSTYEQPIEAWEQELEAAGFRLRDRTLIYPYWWADAYLIEAESPAGDAEAGT